MYTTKQLGNIRHHRRTAMPSIEKTLDSLGLSLPEPSTPVANYVPAVTTGSLIFVSGHIPRYPDGSLIVGKLGEDYTTSEGYDTAKLVTLSLLASIKKQIGSLDRVSKIVRLTCLVNCIPTFIEQPGVANGASDLLIALWGADAGHSRVAIGTASLPGGVPVEIDLIAEYMN
jgi:enamine deaminase RidA (YjgF/YER057c/UK114 family)